MNVRRKSKWAYPGAELVLPADAPREEWLEARTKGIGGSDVSGITGISKYASPYSVWLDKMGLSDEREVTVPMKMGVLLEPIVVQLFTEQTGIATRRAGLLRSRSHPIMQVSLDRLTEDGGVLECKTSNGWLAHEWEDGQVPDHAELQAQHALAVTGKSHAWIGGLLDGRDFLLRRIERDEELIATLIEVEHHFWSAYVLAGVAPAVSRVDSETLRARFSSSSEGDVAVGERSELERLRARYEQAREREKDAGEEKEEVAARVWQLVGGAEELVDEEGTPWFTLKQNGNFSPSKFQRDHPDTAAKFLVPAERLDGKKLAENYPELHRAYRARVLRTPKIKETTTKGEK